MQQCPETPMEDDIVVTMRPTMSLGFNDTNSTCDMLEDCTTCIDIGCAWLGRSCADSCEDANMDEDVVCTVPIMGMSNMDTCNAAADVSLCASKNYCFTCTSTVMSDGITTCSWYVDGAREWCDIGGCNADGICGDPDEASCQVVTDPIGPPAPQLAPTPPPASGALSRHQPTQLFGLVVVAGLVGLGMLA